MDGKLVLRNYFEIIKTNYRSILAILLVFNYLLTQLINNPTFNLIVSLYIYLYILTSLSFLKGTVAKITTGLIIMTVVLLVGNGQFFEVLIEGASVNLSMVCIFIMTPLLGIPVKVGDYLESLKISLLKLKNNVHLSYIFFLSLTHIFSIILNIGSIIINLHLINSSDIRSKRLVASVLNRGYTTTSIWSPYLAVMSLVVSQLKIEWSSLAFKTLGFALLSMFIAFLTELKEINREKKRIKNNEIISPGVVGTDIESIKRNDVRKKIIELIVLLSLSMGLVLVVEKNTSIGMVMSILTVAALFPFIWCALKGKLSNYKEEVVQHAKKTVPSLQGEFTLFLVAGVFSYVFVESPLSIKFIEMLNFLFGSSTLLMSIGLSLIIIVTGIIGLHPAVMLTIFVTALNPEQIGFSPIYFAALLLGSAGIANTVSSGTAVNNLLSNELKVDLFTVSFKWNWLYALFSFLALLLYLQLVIN